GAQGLGGAEDAISHEVHCRRCSGAHHRGPRTVPGKCGGCSGRGRATSSPTVNGSPQRSVRPSSWITCHSPMPLLSYGTGGPRETFSRCARYGRAVPSPVPCVSDSPGSPMTTAAPRRSDRRISPVFLAIVAVMAVTGWATWTGFAEQPGLAVFLFVTAAWVVSLCLHEYAHARTALHSGDLSVGAKGYLTLNPVKYTHALLSIV